MRAGVIVTASVLLLFSAAPLYADSMLDLDRACFRANDSLGYVEVYIAAQQSGLRYKEVGDSIHAEFRVALDVFRDDTVALADTFRALDVRHRDEFAEASGDFYVHAFRFIMQPGEYSLRASLYHWETDPIAEATGSLRVPDWRGDGVEISDIELGTAMERRDDQSVFVKNGIRMIPNATGFYGARLPILYYYAEAYGLDFDSSSADSHIVIRRVLNAENQALVRPEHQTVRATTGTSVVVADGFPLATLRTGTYYLELTVRSLRSGRTATARKKFWTYRAEDFATGRTQHPQPEYEARLAEVDPNFLEVVEADSAEKWMRYILTRDEYRRLRRLNPEGKRRFLREYWQRRERDDPGAGNRYFARVVEANRRYSYLDRPGWKTDRGRIFVVYGESDRTHRNYAMPGTVDHEIWEYNQLEGGVLFVFADMQGFGDLDLVHSTKRGEIYNPDWDKQLRSGDQAPYPYSKSGR